MLFFALAQPQALSSLVMALSVCIYRREFEKGARKEYEKQARVLLEQPQISPPVNKVCSQSMVNDYIQVFGKRIKVYCTTDRAAQL